MLMLLLINHIEVASGFKECERLSVVKPWIRKVHSSAEKAKCQFLSMWNQSILIRF